MSFMVIGIVFSIAKSITGLTKEESPFTPNASKCLTFPSTRFILKTVDYLNKNVMLHVSFELRSGSCWEKNLLGFNLWRMSNS